MNYIHLNKFLSTPLYKQLKDSIKNAILSNELKDNEQLPTEDSICSIFNISRPVVRQAYTELIKEGLIYRVQGKGSFVNKKIMISNLMYTLNGYTAELEKIGLIPESVIISIEIDHRDNLPFELQQTNQDFYLIKRVRKGSGIPLFLEYFYLPKDKFSNFENLFSDNAQFSTIIKNTYGYKDLEIKTSMSAILADDILADILEIDKGQAMFKFVVITQNKNSELYAYKLSFFPGDRHKLEIIEKGDKLYGIYKD
jgi:GntR family transcriptional regulator